VRIIVDADGCPKGVLTACIELGAKHAIEVYTVASFNHNVTSPNHIVVGNMSQEADIKVANLTKANDIVVTQDWALAALVLGKGAICLNPSGMQYKSETIEFMLEERDVKAKYRRSGNRTKGPKKRQPEDDVAFRHKLEQMLVVNKKG